MWFSISVDGRHCFCSNIGGLFKCLSLNHDPRDWLCLMVVPNSVWKLYFSTKEIWNPIARSVHLHESYEHMNLSLHTIDYARCSWKICWNLKVIGMLMEMQSSFTKYYLCLWNSRAFNKGCVNSNWSPRISYQPGLCSVKNIPVVDPGNVLLPPLQTKVGLMKQFMKTTWKKKLQRRSLYITKVSENYTGKVEGGYLCISSKRLSKASTSRQ